MKKEKINFKSADLITSDEVCEKLQISPEVLRNYTNLKIFSFKKINQKKYYSKAEIGYFSSSHQKDPGV